MPFALNRAACHMTCGFVAYWGAIRYGMGRATEGGGMFGELAVLYLFLGGAGAGATAVSCAFDLALVRQPFGFSAGYVPNSSAQPRARTLDFAFALGFALLAAGVVCLMADLGRLDRVTSLFLSPHPTALTVGAYALAALLVLSAALALVRFLYLPDIPQAAVRAAEAAAIAIALVVMAYTGVLLQTIGGVGFWRTPLVPALFLLSSLSCGAAAVFAVAPFAGVADEPQLYMLKLLARFDLAVIALEIIVAAAFLLWAASSDHPGTAASLAVMTQGENALAWWLGFGACGLVAPLVAELALAWRRSERISRRALAIAAALVLAGALCMRWAVTDSGVHRALELQEVEIAALAGATLE